MTRGTGIAKRGFGKALSRTGYADGGNVNEYKDELKGAISGIKEIEEDQDYSSDESSKDYSQGRRHRQVKPDKSEDKDYRNLLKKGGSAKQGLWANINRRKKLGISRPKSKSTISAKAYANMKAGFPKKKK